MVDAQDAQQLVVFTLGAEEYGLPIAQVQEIIRYTPPRSVAAGGGWVRGVIALRGKIVPVHDLVRRLGLAPVATTPTKIVMVDGGRGAAGVVVDDVTEVLTVGGDRIDPPPAGSAAVSGIARIDDRLVVLLDAVALFAEPEAADEPVAAVADAVVATVGGGA
ncbi:chemotaxis protein CheW [Patulibacter defluvii]|uniref:chemotaxis protein CheW n=1 Tax=Patulibacter defluvii TaxID=3095358 RepID=UPI002A74C3EB|nr:chemotaxis protein CheW [Patulibacter sp. DM4]